MTVKAILPALLGDVACRDEYLATRAQRRALMLRDGGCAYPGCLRRRRLQAHHRRSWLNGGATDALERARARNQRRIADYQARQSALAEQADFIATRYAHIDHDRHPQARDVFPPGGGEGYRLADCIEVIFGLTIADEGARPNAA